MTLLRRTGPWLMLLAGASQMAACAADDEAHVSHIEEPIAVGALYPFDISDSCYGGGKVNFCSTENVVSIDTIAVADPKVAAVLRMSELDESLRVASYNLVIDAKAAGRTSVDISATFDDGSTRGAGGTIAAEKADRMELVKTCPVADANALDLLAPGVEVDLTVELYHRNTKLLGEYRRDLVAGEGIARTPGYLVGNRYRWTTPSSATTVAITSPVFPNFASKYPIYDVNSLQIASIEPTYDLSKSVPYQSFVHLDFLATVDGKIPCRFPKVQLETLSPEICGGDDGALTWSVEPSYGLSVQALATGTCQLVASIAGASETHPFAIDLVVESPPPGTVDPCKNVTCDAPVTTCPAGSELVTVNCCTACVPLTDPALCESERTAWDALYDQHRAGTMACATHEDCSTAVLVGGCRRYCYMPFAAQQIAPFMNAVAEAYYTSCPHCSVQNPAPCTDAVTGFACVEGQCTLVH